MNADLLKALLIHASYVGAAATVGVAAGDDRAMVTDDIQLQNPEVRSKNVMVYECAKVHYHALLRAFHDHSGVWPDPKVQEGVSVGVNAGPVSLLLDILKAQRPDTPVGTVGQLLALFGGLGQQPPAPPMPGSELGEAKP